MSDTLKLRILQRTDTREHWLDSRSITLKPGEVGFESDTGLYKIGNGVDHYSLLKYGTGARVIVAGTAPAKADIGQLWQTTESVTIGETTENVVVYYICTGFDSENNALWKKLAFASDLSKDVVEFRKKLSDAQDELSGDISDASDAREEEDGKIQDAIDAEELALQTLKEALLGVEGDDTDTGLVGEIQKTTSDEASDRADADAELTHALFGTAVDAPVNTLAEVTEEDALLYKIANYSKDAVEQFTATIFGESESTSDISTADDGLAGTINTALTDNEDALDEEIGKEQVLASTIYGEGGTQISSLDDVTEDTTGLVKDIDTAVKDLVKAREDADTDEVEALFGEGNEAVTTLADVEGGFFGSVDTAITDTQDEESALKDALYGADHAVVSEISGLGTEGILKDLVSGASSDVKNLEDRLYTHEVENEDGTTETVVGDIDKAYSDVDDNEVAIQENADAIEENADAISTEVTARTTLQSKLYGDGKDAVATLADVEGGILKEIATKIEEASTDEDLKELKVSLFGDEEDDSNIGRLAEMEATDTQNVSDLEEKVFGDEGSDLVLDTILPSYVDDVIEVASFDALPATGEKGKIYLNTADNHTYRWSGTQYTLISASLALGEVAGTAFYGDRGLALETALSGDSTATEGSDEYLGILGRLDIAEKTLDDLGIDSTKTIGKLAYKDTVGLDVEETDEEGNVVSVYKSIEDLAVTEDKIEDDAVITDVLFDESVTAEKISVVLIDCGDAFFDTDDEEDEEEVNP